MSGQGNQPNQPPQIPPSVPPQVPPPASDTPITDIRQIKINVDRTGMEKEYQEQIEKEKLEKQKLNEQLEKAAKELDELKKSSQDKTTEFEKIKKEAEESKNKLTEIAMHEFNRRKDAYIDMMKKAGIPDEKLTELTEKVKTPKDLDDAEKYIDIVSSLLEKAQQNVGTPPGTPPPAPPPKPTGGGTVPLDQQSKDFVYATYREAIDDLYARRAKGDKDADLKIKELWKLAARKLKQERKAFAISQCPVCGGGIMQGETCVYCGFNPANYVKTEGVWS